MGKAKEVPEDSVSELQKKAVQMITERLDAEGCAFFLKPVSEHCLKRAQAGLKNKGHKAIWLYPEAGAVELIHHGSFGDGYTETIITVDELEQFLGVTRDKLKTLFKGSYTVIPRAG